MTRKCFVKSLHDNKCERQFSLPFDLLFLPPMKALSAYLLAYNSVQLLIWSFAFLRILFALIVSLYSNSQAFQSEKLFASVYPVVVTGQTLAWIEVLHAALGIAGGNVGTTGVQSIGRYAILVWVIGSVHESHKWTTTMILFAAWSMGDIIRYLFYIFTLLDISWIHLRWCRYSLFVLLQPVGISAEWLIYWWTLVYIDDRQLYKIKLPNVWNFAFDFGVWNRIVLILYVYFGPLLINHMVKQRRAKLLPKDRTL